MNNTNLFLIRVDASFKIGTGHVIRSLTLANELSNYGNVEFVCLDTYGSLFHMIEENNFVAHRLKYSETQVLWKEDAKKVKEICDKKRPFWLIVDHYQLDHKWENYLNNYCDYLMVIDDLADRSHCCDILLDQTLDRNKDHYVKIVNPKTKMLLGSEYALLRPQFNISQNNILKKRKNITSSVKILISIGGIDESNLIIKILQIIEKELDFAKFEIHIALFSHTKNLDTINRYIKLSKLIIKLHIDVMKMAEIIDTCDIAIGAGGTSLFERACMGIPSIIFKLAENQTNIIKKFVDNDAIIEIDNKKSLSKQLYVGISNIMFDKQFRLKLIKNSLKICDGKGVYRVTSELLNYKA